MSSQPPAPAVPIADYAIVGDCRSAALISKDGSVDWLCWPRFDAASLFAALLDPDRGGRFSVHPASPFAARRRYLGPTNVLETTFTTDSGRLRLIDLMPVAAEQEKRRRLRPAHQLLRALECLDGEVDVEVRYEPRPDYGRRVPRLEDRGRLGIYCEDGARVLALRSEIPLTLRPDSAAARGTARLRRGERRYLSLIQSEGEPAVLPSLGDEATGDIETSLRWWEAWASRCNYDGAYRDAVVRSALVLKLMTYAPSGAVVAAPTTSLPERLGGIRNWDYRYCWLRDASLTLQALFDLGYPKEAEAFLAWLLHATRLTRPELQVVYDVYGETRLPERTLPHLAGYAGSRPVRVGNAASAQFQLDIYGDMLEAVYQFVCRGGRLSRPTARMLVELGETVCRRWPEPDEGIWESRAGRRQHTYSKAMCWVTLDRLLKLHEAGGVKLEIPRARWTKTREAIRAEIELRGYHDGLGSYVSVFGTQELDASLLLLGRIGYADPQGPRMAGTCARVHQRLGANGLLYRYRDATDGLPPGEGAFGISSFWAVTARALQGDLDGAAQAFEHLLALSNDVGLFAEEIDPETGAALGNFPQAFTHVGLIDAALTLEHCARRRVRPTPEQPVQRTREHV